MTLSPHTIAAASRKARYWTAQRDARIRDARECGWTLRQLADAAGLSHSAIARIVKR